jgi:hypothetical protein
MKKISLSLICLLSIAATGFSQPKGNNLSASQSQSVIRYGDKLSFDPCTRMEYDEVVLPEVSIAMFSYEIEMKAVDCTLLFNQKQIFTDKIIYHLFKEQF